MHGKLGGSSSPSILFFLLLFVCFWGAGGESSVIACETVSDKSCQCLEKTWNVPIIPYKAQAQPGDR